MKTRSLMIASAVFMGVAGIAVTFLPEEILTWIGTQPMPALVVMLQITGALYFGFAMTNWMARGVLIGGIYSRPLAIGNFAHFMIAGLGLLKEVFVSPALPWFWLPSVAYAVFALRFGMVLLRHPAQ